MIARGIQKVQKSKPLTTTKIPGLRWYIIGLVFAATLINFIDRLTVSVLAPVIVADLRLNNQQFAQIATWFLVAYSASQALSGRLYDFVGIKRGFTISILVWSAAAMAHAGARSAASLSVFRFILGLGEAGNWPGAAKTAAEWFPPSQRAFAMAIFNSGAALGSVIAPPVIVFLQLNYGWQATFLVTGSLGFLWLVAWLWVYQPPLEHRWIMAEERELIRARRTVAAGEAPLSYARILGFRQTWAIVISRLFTDPVWWLYITWLPLYFNKVHGLDMKQIAWFASVPYLAADAGSLLGGAASGFLMARRGWTVDRARKTVIVISAILMCSGLSVAVLRDPLQILGVISLVTFGFQAWINNVQTMPSDYFAERDVASVAGLGGLGAGIGAMLFTLGTGWVVDHTGYTPVLIAAGIMPLIGTAILLALGGTIRPVVTGTGSTPASA
jgi:ACS family hexuronate transporter-like MFS transporter